MTAGIRAQAQATFGRPVVYTPKAGGGPYSIYGIFAAPHEEVRFGHGAPVSSVHPTLGIRLADLPAAPAKGDTALVNGITYRVIGSDEDGEGGSALQLQQ